MCELSMKMRDKRRAGAHAVIAEQVAERIVAVVAELKAFGVNSLGIPTDVSRVEDVRRMAQRLDRSFRAKITSSPARASPEEPWLDPAVVAARLGQWSDRTDKR